MKIEVVFVFLITKSNKMDYTGFLIAGLSSAGATVITNPLEVVKTRMQLQGELAAKGTHIEPYRNVFQAFYKIAKNDGYFGLQKGLSAALCFQFILNACRYEKKICLKFNFNNKSN